MPINPYGWNPLLRCLTETGERSFHPKPFSKLCSTLIRSEITDLSLTWNSSNKETYTLATCLSAMSSPNKAYRSKNLPGYTSSAHHHINIWWDSANSGQEECIPNGWPVTKDTKESPRFTIRLLAGHGADNCGFSPAYLLGRVDREGSEVLVFARV